MHFTEAFRIACIVCVLAVGAHSDNAGYRLRSLVIVLSALNNGLNNTYQVLHVFTRLITVVPSAAALQEKFAETSMDPMWRHSGRTESLQSSRESCNDPGQAGMRNRSTVWQCQCDRTSSDYAVDQWRIDRGRLHVTEGQYNRQRSGGGAGSTIVDNLFVATRVSCRLKDPYRTPGSRLSSYACSVRNW